MNYLIEQRQIKFWLCVIGLTLLALALSGLSLEIKLSGLAIVLSLVYLSRGLFAALFYLLAVLPFFAALSVGSSISLLMAYTLALIIFEFFFTSLSLNLRQQVLLLIGISFACDFILSQWRSLLNLEFNFALFGDGLSLALTALLALILIPYLMTKDFTSYVSSPEIEQLDLFTIKSKKIRSRRRPF